MYTIKMGSHLPASLCELPNFERPSRIGPTVLSGFACRAELIVLAHESSHLHASAKEPSF